MLLSLDELAGFRIPVIIAAGALIGLLVGIIMQRLVLSRLARLAARTSWKADDVIIASLRGLAPIWCLLAGAYIAMESVGEWAALPTARRVVVVLAIFSAAMAFARLVGGLITASMQRQEGMQRSVSIIQNVARLTVMTVGILVILQYLGISVTPILTALGVGGLAVALALQDTLSNLFAGIQIIASTKIKPGDFVQLESGENGYVTDVTWRNTTIRALGNNLVIVPNAKLASSLVTNFSQPILELSVLVDLGVSYGSDLEKVERVTIEVAREVMKEVEGGMPDFQPFIRFNAFGDWAIRFSVILRAREYTNQYLIRHEFIKRLHRRYAAEGIEIPFPIRTVQMRSDDRITRQ